VIEFLTQQQHARWNFKSFFTAVTLLSAAATELHRAAAAAV